MKRITGLMVLSLLIFGHSSLFPQTNDTLFWRGVYLFQQTQVNSREMRDSIHVNVTMASTGGTWTSPDSILDNPAGLKMVNQRQLLAHKTWAQRMIFEAEQEQDPVKNYFARKHLQIQLAEDDTAMALFPPSAAGMMVDSVTPDNEYRYGITDYWATFRLRIDHPVPPPPGTTAVVDCEVYCNTHQEMLADTALLFSDFPGSDYIDCDLSFSLDPPPCNPPCNQDASFLTGGEFDRYVGSPCENVDMRVYWHGNITTYLDKATVEDQTARNLFAGVDDNSIKTEAATQIGTHPLHWAFYLRDEPLVSSYLAFNYVGNRIKDTLNNGPGSGSVTATYQLADYQHFERFLVDATPSRLMIDPYFIRSDAPHPSIANNDVADSAGIAHWDYSTYLSEIQSELDTQLVYQYRPGAELAQQYSIPLIHIPQLHGVLWSTTDKYRQPGGSQALRPPAPSEISMQYGLGLVYGARGFLSYPFPTYLKAVGWNGDTVGFPGLVSWELLNGYYDDHSSNITAMPSGSTWNGKVIWTGYKEKWDEVAAQNQSLKLIEDTLLTLDWLGAKSWNNGLTAGAGVSVVTSVVAKDTLNEVIDVVPYIDIGHLLGNGFDYLVVLNRRCANEDFRNIELTFSSQPTNLLITDMVNTKSWVVKGSSPFTDGFQPGEWKVYKLETATVSGSRSFPALEFRDGARLTLSNSANVTAGGDMDTVRVVFGNGSTFKADTGSTMLVIDDTSFVLGSNSTLEIHGTATLGSNETWTIPEGATMKVFGTGTLKFGASSSLLIKGTIRGRRNKRSDGSLHTIWRFFMERDHDSECKYTSNGNTQLCEGRTLCHSS